MVESHSPTETDKNGRLLDGSLIGIPVSDAEGRVVLKPIKIDLRSQSLRLRNGRDTVLEGTAIYPTKVTNAPDALVGFDATGQGNFPSVNIKTDVRKYTLAVQNISPGTLEMSDDPNFYSHTHRRGAVGVGKEAVAFCIVYDGEHPENTSLYVGYGGKGGDISVYTAATKTYRGGELQITPGLKVLQDKLPDC